MKFSATNINQIVDIIPIFYFLTKLGISPYQPPGVSVNSPQAPAQDAEDDVISEICGLSPALKRWHTKTI